MSNDNKIAEQLFDNGFAETDVKLLDGKISAKIRNINALRQLKLEGEMSEIKGSTAFILHTYSCKLLEMTLMEYNGQKINNVEEAKKLIESLPGVAVDFLVKEQSKFEKEVAKAYTGEVIESNFFDQPSTDSESKPSSEAVTSETEAVTKS